MLIDVIDAAFVEFERLARVRIMAHIQVRHKLEIICEQGLDGEPLIAVVDGRYSLYLIEPAYPGPPFLLAHDVTIPDEIKLVKFLSTKELRKCSTYDFVKLLVSTYAFVPYDICIINQ